MICECSSIINDEWLERNKQSIVNEYAEAIIEEDEHLYPEDQLIPKLKGVTVQQLILGNEQLWEKLKLEYSNFIDAKSAYDYSTGCYYKLDDYIPKIYAIINNAIKV